MTPEEIVRGCAGPVGRLGGAWMFDAETNRRGDELGLTTWSWYHCGRGGVLGDGPADAVIAAFGFFPPEQQRQAWDKGRELMPAPEIARHYARACVDWGRRVLDDAADPDRLADLLTRVVEAVEPAGLPVFAGWRSLLRDADAEGPGRLALALQVAREHRGGAHLVAVVAQGVGPLQAVVSGRYGPTNAQFFGWPEPWPDPAAAKQQMAAAEELTDRIVLPAFTVLSPEEGDELVAGLRSLRV